MNTQQLIALLQSIDPSGSKRVKFQNISTTPVLTGDEVDIVGGTSTQDVILQNPK